MIRRTGTYRATDYGVITTDGKAATIDRLGDLDNCIGEVIDDAWCRDDISEGICACGVVCEVPAVGKGARHGYDKQSQITAAAYGMAAGVCAAHLATIASRMMPALAAPADQWPRNFACKVDGDRYKTGRVRQAAALVGIGVADMGTKAQAADVADAILLGIWAWPRLQKLTDLPLDRVVAFDPALGSTGWAVIQEHDR